MALRSTRGEEVSQAGFGRHRPARATLLPVLAGRWWWSHHRVCANDAVLLLQADFSHLSGAPREFERDRAPRALCEICPQLPAGVFPSSSMPAAVKRVSRGGVTGFCPHPPPQAPGETPERYAKSQTLPCKWAKLPLPERPGLDPPPSGNSIKGMHSSFGHFAASGWLDRDSPPAQCPSVRHGAQH